MLRVSAKFWSTGHLALMASTMRRVSRATCRACFAISSEATIQGTPRPGEGSATPKRSTGRRSGSTAAQAHAETPRERARTASTVIPVAEVSSR